MTTVVCRTESTETGEQIVEEVEAQLDDREGPIGHAEEIDFEIDEAAVETPVLMVNRGDDVTETYPRYTRLILRRLVDSADIEIAGVFLDNEWWQPGIPEHSRPEPIPK